MTKKEKIEKVIKILEENEFKPNEFGLLWKLASAIKKTKEKLTKDEQYSDCFKETVVEKFDQWKNFNKIINFLLEKKGYELSDIVTINKPKELEKSLVTEDFEKIKNNATYISSIRKNLKDELK